jgi:hypothetical protein
MINKLIAIVQFNTKSMIDNVIATSHRGCISAVRDFSCKQDRKQLSMKFNSGKEEEGMRLRNRSTTTWLVLIHDHKGHDDEMC